LIGEDDAPDNGDTSDLLAGNPGDNNGGENPDDSGGNPLIGDNPQTHAQRAFAAFQQQHPEAAAVAFQQQENSGNILRGFLSGEIDSYSLGNVSLGGIEGAVYEARRERGRNGGVRIILAARRIIRTTRAGCEAAAAVESPCAAFIPDAETMVTATRGSTQNGDRTTIEVPDWQAGGIQGCGPDGRCSPVWIYNEAATEATHRKGQGLIEVIYESSYGEPFKLSGVTSPPGRVSLADIGKDYLSPAQEDVDLRAGEELANVPVLTDEYTNDRDAPAVHVQHLSYANLGIWLLDNTFDDDGDGTNLNNADDGLHYAYRLLTDNRVSSVPSSGSASYDLEADIIYKGERFYPDNDGLVASGKLNADFGANTLSGKIRMRGDTRDYSNYFGGSTLSSGGTIPDLSFMTLTIGGMIASDGTFSGDVADGGGLIAGFFADLDGVTGGEFSGAFFDAADYDPTTDGAPAEVGGTFSITDTNGETLSGGFLGAKR
jgi:hypothetical protein